MLHTRPVYRYLAFILTLLIGVLATGAYSSVLAQAGENLPIEPSAYWQYDAPGPLGIVLVADVDQNGVQDFVAITDGSQAVLINAAGRVQWTFQTPSQAPILQATTLNVDGASNLPLEILLATRDELLLLGADGDLIWRKPLDLPPIPAVLLTGAIDESRRNALNNRPIHITGFDGDGDGNEQLLVVLQSGLIQLYNEAGDLLWDYPDAPPDSEDPLPLVAVGDLDADGRSEIVFSYYVRYTIITVLDSEGNPRWDEPLSGRTTALELVPWDDGDGMDIAIGRNFRDEEREVIVFDAEGNTRWFRTPNRTITDLKVAELPQGRSLIVGTDVGTVAAYDGEGRRLWRFLPETPERGVISISPRQGPALQEGQPALALTLAPGAPDSNESAMVLLLDEGGRALQQFTAASSSGQTRLIDANGDQINELLLASFGTLALTDPGTGARKNAQAWDYRLFAAPLSMLTADLNLDGEDELLVGTRDGQLHIVESSNGQAGAIVNTGGQVSHLALLPSASGNDETLIVAVHNHVADVAQGTPDTGYVELIQPTGRVVWSDPLALPGAVTGVATGNVNRDGAPEIVAGTSEGELVVYSPGARELWRASVSGGITQLLLVDNNADGQHEIIALTDESQIVRFEEGGAAQVVAQLNMQEVQQIVPLPREDGAELAFMVVTEDGLLRAITWQGALAWQWQLPEGRVLDARAAGGSILVASSAGRLLSLDVTSREISWQLENVGQVSALYWGNLDGGGVNDLALGNRAGQIFLHASDGRSWDNVHLSSSSSVFGLAGVRRSQGQEAQLVVITDNGVVQLYEAKPNRPPLLVDPRVEVAAGRYDVRVVVVEEDGDEVTVALEAFDEQTEQWATLEQRPIIGRDNLIFPVAATEGAGLRYRLTFDDGTHQGVITPPPGPPAPAAQSVRSTIIVPALLLMALLSIILIIRQLLNVDSRARRFYRRLQQQPAQTLSLLDEQYREIDGSPDFLLSLGNRARPDRNLPLINLIDGLFLLHGRPGAAIAILDSALKEARELSPTWDALPCWQRTVALSRDMLEAPTVTELSLLRPKLAQLLEKYELSSPASDLAPFLPVLTSLRDSERVDLAEDRIVYLHEALALLRQISEASAAQPISIGGRIQRLLRSRLSGLVSADIELLRGQAQLVARLKTKRVLPENGQAVVALEIRNKGRAAARNISVVMEPDAAYEIDSRPQQAAVITPGRAMIAEFQLRPGVDDRFRAAFSITYDDRSQDRRRLQFADMVNLLPPVRDFHPISNPYLPGTPLRSDSPIFYGREELFNFITENAGQIARRNVLILVGQRRTGKTSLLLRLDHHLPSHLIPIYIDCQALGVMPGMPALFHDLAWHIADGLALRGYDVDVPDIDSWRQDPTRLFRHEFLPTVRELLPAEATLFLVFDEFEAFENLVNDGILPPTLFTYMRHLMQHSDDLSFVFVGTRRLEEMTSDYWSVLFNIALYRQIDFLSKEAARRLITEPVAPHILYDDLALDKIWRVTAGHPYFLQLVCYTLIKRANVKKTGYVTISDVNAALEEMLRLGEVHFAYIWQRSTYTERALLTAVAHLMERDVPFHPTDLVQYLEQYGFRFDAAEVTAGLNRLVEREIMRELTDEGTTIYELRIGLVGLWAAQNKSLNKLYESRNGSNGADAVRINAERI